MSNVKTSPLEFLNEVICCIADNSCTVTGHDDEERLYQAEGRMRDVFKEISAIYEHPRYEDILKAMSHLAAHELKAGGSSKKVAENFLRIGKKIKASCGM